MMRGLYLLAASVVLVLAVTAEAECQATYTNQHTMATTEAFVNRVQIALVTAAVAVRNETPNADPNIHQMRQAYAARVLANPSVEGAKMAVGVATNSTIAASAPTGAGASDSDILFTVNSMFSAYALTASPPR